MAELIKVTSLHSNVILSPLISPLMLFPPNTSLLIVEEVIVKEISPKISAWFAPP